MVNGHPSRPLRYDEPVKGRLDEIPKAGHIDQDRVTDGIDEQNLHEWGGTFQGIIEQGLGQFPALVSVPDK